MREIWLDGRSVAPIAMHLHALPIENYLLPTISCGVGYCVNQHLSPALSHGSADVAARAAGQYPRDVFKGVRRILVRGVNAPLPPEAKKILKI